MKVHQLLEAKKELGVSLHAKVSATLKAAVKEFTVPDVGTFKSSPFPGHDGMFKIDIFTQSQILDPATIADLHDDPETRKAMKQKVEASRAKKMHDVIAARKKIFRKVIDFAIQNGVKKIGVGTGRKAYVDPSEVKFDEIDFTAPEVRFSLMFPHELEGKVINLVKEREHVLELLSKDKELKKKYVIDNGMSGPIFKLNATELKKFIEKEKDQIDFDIKRYMDLTADDIKKNGNRYGPTPSEYKDHLKKSYDYTNPKNFTEPFIVSLRCLTQYLVITEMGKQILADLNAAIERIDHLTPAKLSAKLEEKRPIWLRHHDHTIARISVSKPKYEKENYKGS